jgi:uncharacterized membrane protein YcgQ (UPF0703/DUF1980 family)
MPKHDVFFVTHFSICHSFLDALLYAILNTILDLSLRDDQWKGIVGAILEAEYSKHSLHRIINYLTLPIKIKKESDFLT